MALGKKIRICRKRQGLTLDKLSQLSGVDVGTIGALEKRDSVRSRYASALAKALGMSVEQLEAVVESEDIDREEITITDVAQQPPDANFFLVNNRRTVARPPLTDEEYDIIDGYRLATELQKQQILGLCLIVLRTKEARGGGREKKA